MTGARLSAEALSVGYDKRAVIRELSATIEPSTVTALVGPNGCGKSTLLRALARLLKPQGGAVHLDGEAINKLSTRAVARMLAILPQGPSVPEGITVRELVEQGRYPHVGPLNMLTRQDHESIRRAIELTDLEAFVNRTVDQLSGGERQRVWIAMTLAQGTSIMLLDEPTSFLDIRHQMEVLELVRRLNRDEGLTVVMALHDLNHASRFADRVLAMKDGSVVADGTGSEVISHDLLASVFGVRARILHDEDTGVPICIPLGVFDVDRSSSTTESVPNP
ncbi:MAG: ABC transporter ATP-binding protein [Acidimicrobiales bacterium]